MGKIYADSWAQYKRSFLVIALICAFVEGLGFVFDGAGNISGRLIGYFLIFYYIHRDLLLGESNLALKGGLFERKGKTDNKGVFKFSLILLVIAGLTSVGLIAVGFAILAAGVERRVGVVLMTPFVLPVFLLSFAFLGPLLAAATVQDKGLTFARCASKFGRSLWQMLLGPMPIGFAIMILVIAGGSVVFQQIDDGQIAIYSAFIGAISMVLFFFPITMAVRVVCGIYRELRPAPMEDVFA